VTGRSLVLTEDQAALLVYALADARDYRTGLVIGCADCDQAETAGEPSAACERHRPDMQQADRYDELGQLIGAWVEARDG